MTFAEEIAEIDSQIESLLKEKGLTRNDMYEHKFSEGEKFVLLKLLETRMRIVREELIYMHQKFTNVVFISSWKAKGSKR